MRRVFLSVFSAFSGICLAVAVHCSFMTVEVHSSLMLPDIEPGQKVVVFLLEKERDIQKGDVVAFKPAFYTVGDEDGILLRKVREVKDDRVVLSCGEKATRKDEVEISKSDILGRAIMF